MRNLLPKLRSLERLTPTEKKIVAFFERHLQQLAFDSLTGLSAKAGVSKTSLNRFLMQRLGYRGFKQFKAERQKEIEHQLESPIQRYQRQNDGSWKTATQNPTPFQRRITEYMQHIQTVGDYLDQAALEKAADALSQTDRGLYVLGQRMSFSLAYILATNLQYIRSDVFLMRDDHTSLPTEIFNTKPGDVLFVISRRRYSENTCRLASYLRRSGLSIVAATDSEVSPIVPLADVLLVIPSLETGSFEGLGAQVAVIETLVLMAADKCRESEKSYFQKAENILTEFFCQIQDSGSPPFTDNRLNVSELS